MKLFLNVIAIGLLLAGCEAPKKPVESLSFEEKKAIVEECDKNGKIATDHYCKEVAVVYNREVFVKKQNERVDESQSRKYITNIKE